MMDEDVNTVLNNFDEITKKDEKAMSLICEDLLSVPPKI